jgi:hypothetical protein
VGEESGLDVLTMVIFRVDLPISSKSQQVLTGRYHHFTRWWAAFVLLAPTTEVTDSSIVNRQKASGNVRGLAWRQ